jgi:arylsulfatase A-like enzyme
MDRENLERTSARVSLAGYALAGATASLLLSLIEWLDLNIQVTPVFHSATDRLTLGAYFSINLVVGTAFGFAAGLCVQMARPLLGTLARRLDVAGARGAMIRALAALILSAAFAVVLYQQPALYRFALSITREAGKVRFGETIRSYENTVCYFVLVGLVIAAVVAHALAGRAKNWPSALRKLWVLALSAAILAIYYIDSRVEVQQYEYSFHRLMFLMNFVLALMLVSVIHDSSARLKRLRSAPRSPARKVVTALVVVVFLASVAFTLARFGDDQDLKTQVFYRTTRAKQNFQLVQWVLDFDRDGYSPYLGGGDTDDGRADINPAALEVVADHIDNNGIGGDLTEQAIAEWRRERESLNTAPNPRAKRFNVIYIFVDTVRADHLGTYGYTRNKTSPNIDKLAARSSVFELGLTPSPSTFEAVPKFMQSSYWDAQVDPWPEVLHRAGYDTILFPGRRIETIPRRLKSPNMRVRSKTRDVEQTIDDVIEVLSQEPPDRPFCSYVYSSEPHRPYKRHPRFDFGSSLADLYDSEIAYSDYQYGRLFDWLEQTGHLDDTMVILMSDHGESLGERGVYKHTSQVYNEQMHVPVIFHIPGVQPGRIPNPISTIDLGTTILHAVGLPSPPEYAGVNLLPLMRGEPFTHPPIFGEHIHRSDSPYVDPDDILDPETRKYMVIDPQGYKLIYNRNFYSFELYSLTEDPGELHNIYDEMPQKAAELRRLLGRFIDIVLVSRPRNSIDRKYSMGNLSDEKLDED